MDISQPVGQYLPLRGPEEPSRKKEEPTVIVAAGFFAKSDKPSCQSLAIGIFKLARKIKAIESARSIDRWALQPQADYEKLRGLQNRYNRDCRKHPEYYRPLDKHVPFDALYVATETNFYPEFYSISPEALAAARPSAFGLFVRDAGQAIENVMLPAIIIGGLMFGAMKAVETGDISTLQRVWVAVR